MTLSLNDSGPLDDDSEIFGSATLSPIIAGIVTEILKLSLNVAPAKQNLDNAIELKITNTINIFFIASASFSTKKAHCIDCKGLVVNENRLIDGLR